MQSLLPSHGNKSYSVLKLQGSFTTTHRVMKLSQIKFHVSSSCPLYCIHLVCFSIHTSKSEYPSDCKSFSFCVWQFFFVALFTSRLSSIIFAYPLQYFCLSDKLSYVLNLMIVYGLLFRRGIQTIFTWCFVLYYMLFFLIQHNYTTFT